VLAVVQDREHGVLGAQQCLTPLFRRPASMHHRRKDDASENEVGGEFQAALVEDVGDCGVGVAVE